MGPFSVCPLASRRSFRTAMGLRPGWTWPSYNGEGPSFHNGAKGINASGGLDLLWFVVTNGWVSSCFTVHR